MKLGGICEMLRLTGRQPVKSVVLVTRGREELTRFIKSSACRRKTESSWIQEVIFASIHKQNQYRTEHKMDWRAAMVVIMALAFQH
jgi:hypothetical protein